MRAGGVGNIVNIIIYTCIECLILTEQGYLMMFI